MARAITQLPPELATIRRGLAHQIPIQYQDDQGRFLSLADHEIEGNLRSDRALDSSLLGTYSSGILDSDYGQLAPVLDETSSGSLLVGSGWVTVKIRGASTGDVWKLLVDAPVQIV